MKKVLIIEDNPEIADLVRDLLHKEGYETSVCQDAYQGITLTHRLKPDLMLLDLMLPAGGGFSVLEKAKLSTLTRDVPVVVLTASQDDEHKKKALSMGVTAFMQKPFESRDLLQTIRRVLGDDNPDG